MVRMPSSLGMTDVGTNGAKCDDGTVMGTGAAWARIAAGGASGGAVDGADAARATAACTTEPPVPRGV